jgi:hypothetical protein
VADVREFSLAPRQFTTRCGGLFLFVADLVCLGTEKLARAAGFPGSQMIPAEHALRACLALKLWSIERKSHVMAWVADEGLALFAGLNAFPKKSYLSGDLPLHCLLEADPWPSASPLGVRFQVNHLRRPGSDTF